MNIALFSSSSRIAIAIAAVLLVVAALIAVKRGQARAGAVFGVGALAALGALAGEGLVALTVWLAAPEAADFALPDDVGDPSMAHLDQMGRRQLGTPVVVVGDDIDSR